MEHDGYCNCEECWWARDQQVICPTCGCLESSCPCTEVSDVSNESIVRVDQESY
jgi:hypothetical protein